MKYAFRFGGLMGAVVLVLLTFVVSPVYGASRVPKVKIFSPTGSEKITIGKETTIRWSEDIWGFDIKPENVLYFSLEAQDKNGSSGVTESVKGKDITKYALAWIPRHVRVGDTFESIKPGRYKLTVRLQDRAWKCWSPFDCPHLGGKNEAGENDKDVRLIGEDKSGVFTIVEDPKKPKLTLLYPNGGENIKLFVDKIYTDQYSQEVSIRWKLNNITIKPENVLEFYLRNLKGPAISLAGTAVSGKDIKKGVFKTVFSIPKEAKFAKFNEYILHADLISSSTARVSNTIARDTSESFTFTIAQSEKPKLTILYPNGGENIKIVDKKALDRGVTIRWKLNDVTVKPENVLSFSLEDEKGSRYPLAGATVSGEDIKKGALKTIFSTLNIDISEFAKSGKYKLVANLTSKGVCEPFNCMLEGRDNKDVEYIAYDESDRFFRWTMAPLEKIK